MATISVVIPLYNKRNYVSRALYSVLNQTFQDFEIIIVDDGSTDDGPSIVQSIKDPRIRLFRQANAGPGAARNRGVRESTSEFVTFLDSDDEYLPHFLQASLDNLLAHPDCALSVANHYRGIEKTLATDIFPFNIGITDGPWRLPPESEPAFVWGSLIFMQTWVIMARREVLEEFGGFYENHCTYAEDQYCWLKILLNRKIYRDTTPLFWYHSENSELEMFSRTSTTPIWPFLTDPDPIRESCPEEYRQTLERLFVYAARLNYSYIVSNPEIIGFWREYLRGVPEAHDIRLDYPRPVERIGTIGIHDFVLDAAASAGVRAACESLSLTPETFFLASLVFLAWKYSGQETIVVGNPYSNPALEKRQGLFGCYARTIPIRVDVDDGHDLGTWLQYVRDQFEKAWAHTSIGTEELMDLVDVPRSGSIRPISQIGFAMAGDSVSTGDAATFARSISERGIDGNDLALYVIDSGVFELAFEYSAELFSADSASMLAANFRRVVAALAEGFGRRLGGIDLMDREGLALIGETNRTDRPEFRGRTFLELFEESVRVHGDSIAVKSIVDGVVLSYAELDAVSGKIAEKLIASGAKDRSLIGLYMNRDHWLLPSFIGIWKAGCGYVPLDPNYPRGRNEGIVRDAGIGIVVTTGALSDEAVALGDGLRIVRVDAADQGPDAALPEVSHDHTAYVLFTSGSTGKPKGVPIRHGSLANLLLSMSEAPGISSSDKVVALTTFTFDMHTLEFFLPLIAGSSLVLVDHESSLEGPKLVSLIGEEGISFIQATPSRWHLLCEAGLKCTPGMTLVTGGEALTEALAETLSATGSAVWNNYGPTETTVWSSLCRLEARSFSPSIGKPIANTGFFVLDGNGRPLPPGIPGELAISGEGLSEGYLNRPDLSADRFVTIDFGGDRMRVYRSGDLVQQRPSGEFLCFGRNDFQVKIRGYRVELGEIETVMLGFPGIKEAACAVWAKTQQDKRLIAYYRSEGRVDEAALLQRIKSCLPDYMIPGHFIALSSFPRTSSGKTDRKALPLPSAESDARAAAEKKQTVSSFQEVVLTIWKEVLGLENIGVDENFFDLGGHSILAIELIRKLNARTGSKWMLRDLFEAPTIEALERKVGRIAESRMPMLFPINKHGNGAPLFLVCGVYSLNYFEDESNSRFEQDFMRYFSNLLMILGNERPVYGLRPRGIYRGEHFHTSVEEMASEYIREITAIQPEGPYYIGGECIGGVVAHAIACQLNAQGAIVKRLILLDTYRVRPLREVYFRVDDLLSDLRGMRWRFLLFYQRWISRPGTCGIEPSPELGSSTQAPWTFQARKNRIAAFKAALAKAFIRFFPVTDEMRAIRTSIIGARKYSNILLHYRAKPYSGMTVLCINEEWNKKHPTLFWNSTDLHNVNIRVVPGDHSTRLKNKTESLERCLKESFTGE
jgi:amino acid adenylation domain-containing protein